MLVTPGPSTRECWWETGWVNQPARLGLASLWTLGCVYDDCNWTVFPALTQLSHLLTCTSDSFQTFPYPWIWFDVTLGPYLNFTSCWPNILYLGDDFVQHSPGETSGRTEDFISIPRTNFIFQHGPFMLENGQCTCRALAVPGHTHPQFSFPKVFVLYSQVQGSRSLRQFPSLW